MTPQNITDPSDWCDFAACRAVMLEAKGNEAICTFSRTDLYKIGEQYDITVGLISAVEKELALFDLV